MPASTSRGRETAGRQVARADARDRPRVVSVARLSAGFAAGDDPLHHFRRRAEGGRAFGGIQHAQPPAGAGADVKQPAAALKSRGNGVDGARNSRDLALHGARHQGVFGIDDAQHVFGGQVSMVGRSGIGLFGEEVGEHAISG